MIHKILIVLLAIAVIFFVTFPFIKRFVLRRNFRKAYGSKINSFARRNHFSILNNVNLKDYGKDNVKIDHLVFGNKFVYIISDYFLPGIVAGTTADNSWIYVNKIGKESSYIPNLFVSAKDKLEKLSKLQKIDQNLLISISLLSNESDVRIKERNIENCYLTKAMNVIKTIRKIEKRNVTLIDKEQLKIVVEEINERSSY